MNEKTLIEKELQPESNEARLELRETLKRFGEQVRVCLARKIFALKGDFQNSNTYSNTKILKTG
jgi:hypothetical protein